MRKIPQSVTEVIHLLFLAINRKLSSTPFEESIVDDDISDDWLSNQIASLSQIDDIGSPPRRVTDNDNERTLSIEGAQAPETATETTETQKIQSQTENSQFIDGDTNMSNFTNRQVEIATSIAGQVQQLSTSNTIDPNISSILQTLALIAANLSAAQIESANFQEIMVASSKERERREIKEIEK